MAETNVFYSCKDIVRLFENVEIGKLVFWFQANKLSLNVKTINYILFGFKMYVLSNTLNRVINNKIIDRVPAVKFLSVYVDEKLSWKDHVSYIKAKVAKGLGIMTRVQK